MSVRFVNSVFAHDWSKDFRYDHRSIGLLVVFQNSENRPADGHGGTIERVHESSSLLSWNLIADVKPARLIIRAIGRAGDFAVFPCLSSPRHPGLQVVLAIGRSAQIAGTR